MDVEAEFPSVVAERLEVSRVVTVPARKQRQHRIIHLCNWHLVLRELFIKALDADGIMGDHAEAIYQRHLDEVESVQAEQLILMTFFVNSLGLEFVHVEGLISDELDAFKKRLQRIKKADVSASREPAEKFSAGIVRTDRLMVGVAGQMAIDEKLTVLPVEERTAFEASNPILADGTYIENEPAVESRESAIVRNMLKFGPVSFIVMGGAHDLSDNVPDDCEYIRIETKRYSELMEAHQWRAARVE